MRVKSKTDNIWSIQSSKPIPKLDRYVYMHCNLDSITVFETFTPEQAREMAGQFLSASMDAEIPQEVIQQRLQKSIEEFNNHDDNTS